MFSGECDDGPTTLAPFDRDAAMRKVQAAEDAWNTRDPERVAGAYTVDSVWRNRDSFFSGREAIVSFLTAKWQRESADSGMAVSLAAGEAAGR
jgi:uncharacterized protein (TIGR02246 family)